MKSLLEFVVKNKVNNTYKIYYFKINDSYFMLLNSLDDYHIIGKSWAKESSDNTFDAIFRTLKNRKIETIEEADKQYYFFAEPAYNRQDNKIIYHQIIDKHQLDNLKYIDTITLDNFNYNYWKNKNWAK